jgi:hypothetical protein
MNIDLWAAVAATVVALALAARFWTSYRAKHHTYSLWWSIAFAVTGLAAVTQATALSAGRFTPGTYGAYVIMAAAVPGLMGVGSLYLLVRRLAPYFAGLVLVLCALTALGVFMGPLDSALLGQVMKASQEVTRVLPGALVVMGFAFLGGLGGAAMVVGAVWSWWKTHQVFNLGIALGGIIFSLADTLAAYGIPGLFYGAEIVGVLVLYWAVVRSRAPEPGRGRAAAAHDHA